MGKRGSNFKNKNKDKKRPKITQKSGALNEVNKKGFGPGIKQNQDSEFEQQVDNYTDSPGRSDEEHDLNQDDGSEFNNLLQALSSGNKNLADLYKKRQREQEGLSDSDEDEDDINEEEISEEGSGDESDLLDLDEEGSGDESEPSDFNENDEEINQENKNEDSVEEYSDEEKIIEKDNLSSFYIHLTKSLTKEELDKLKEKKWKFKWEIPAVDIQSSKWIGTGESISKEIGFDMGCSLKEKIHKHWLSINKSSESTKENFFFSLFNTYRDILHCNKKPFYMKGTEEDSSIMDAYLLHSLNHVYRTRELVIKNDTKLNKLESKKEEIIRDDSYLDQGFTRPKVLFLLPMKSIALRVVLRLIQLTPLLKKDNVDHLDRFGEEYGAIDDENEINEKKKSSKPADFRALFGGNNDDHFILGMKFTKRSIKLYSDFYSSDIIIASPLGIITKIGETEYNKDKDIDYLSSIEVVVIDHADIISMQNWMHVNTIFEHLNKTPSKQHGTDMMRIRPWYLDGQAQFYRQTILLSSYLNPDINALFNRLCVNYEGKVKLVSEHKGVLPKILLQVQQIYERFNPSSIVDADDARLEYFCKKVFPKIKDSIEGGIMLFMSSYFEFVRIRNFLKAQNASFCLLGDYTTQSDISRARVWLLEGKRKIMLYTERAHFYHRYKISGIKNLIIYSLPERKELYAEIINMIDVSRNNTCRVLFSPFDLLKLERIVGTSSAKRLLSSDKDMFVFS